jgi:hypothetical protein
MLFPALFFAHFDGGKVLEIVAMPQLSTIE